VKEEGQPLCRAGLRCRDNSYTPTTGDFVGILQVDLTPPWASLLNPGQTRSVTIHYRRF